MLVRQTLEFLRAGRLISPGQKILAAVSGGRDSCVMLHILYALRRDLGIGLAVAHFNHNLRPQSGTEQEFVRQLAADYGLPFYGGSGDVPALAIGGNIEDTARKARYAFLRQAAKEANAQLIATAHHSRDQAETVLLHLLRGSGLEGLAAISPLERDLLRPILFAQPTQIEEYRANANLAFCQDESNNDTAFLRNRLRLDILPQLLQINPRLLNALYATADICRQDNDLLNTLAQEALAKLWVKDKQLIAADIYELPAALQRRLLRLAVSEAGGDRQTLSYEHTIAALSLKEEQSLTISGGWQIYRRHGLYITKEKQPPLPRHEEYIPLNPDGCWHTLADWGWAYKCQRAEGEAQIPPDSIILPAVMENMLAFRTRRPGDWLPSQGKNGRKKLKDAFIDAKIPPYQRPGWPLLLCNKDIIWLPRLYLQKIRTVTPGIIITVKQLEK